MKYMSYTCLMQGQMHVTPHLLLVLEIDIWDLCKYDMRSATFCRGFCLLKYKKSYDSISYLSWITFYVVIENIVYVMLFDMLLGCGNTFLTGVSFTKSTLTSLDVSLVWY